MMRQKFTLGILGLALLAGCTGNPAPEQEVVISKAPAIDAPTAPASRPTEPYTKSMAGYRFTVPADWEAQPPKSEFVLGEFSIPGEGGPARLTLSSAGGGIEANLDRWRGQVQRGPKDPEPRESEIEFDGTKGTLLELAGTYSDMFSGGSPTRDWRMLGVAVPIGGTNYFLKLTGPAGTVDPRRDEFVKFVTSARSDR